MKKKVIVAFSNQQRMCPWIGRAYPMVELEKHFVMVHHDPRTALRKNKVSANFDMLVDFGHEPDTYHSTALGKRYISIPRIPKELQICKLKALIDIHKLKVELPETYTCPAGTLHEYNVPVMQHGKYVIKRQHGANGHRQILIDDFLISDMLAFPNDSLSMLKEKFPSLVGTKYDHGKEDGGPYLGEPSFVIQRYIPDIVNEFRVIVAGKKLFIRKRNRTEGDYPQVDSNVTAVIEAESNLCPIWDEWFLERGWGAAHKLITKMDLLLGSVDLYEREDGSVGVFEYSNEFRIPGIASWQSQGILEGFFQELVEKL